MNDNIELIYPSAKYLEYIVNSNIDYQNLSMRNIFKLINQFGILPESIVDKHIFQSYSNNKLNNIFKIQYYRIIKDIDLIKNLLIDDNLLIVNISIYSSFENDNLKKNSKMTNIIHNPSISH